MRRGTFGDMTYHEDDIQKHRVDPQGDRPPTEGISLEKIKVDFLPFEV